MNSRSLGRAVVGPEITNVSSHGVWVLIEGRELFMSYEEFPWFKEATVEQILHLEMPSEGHLYWPDLDIDLSVDMIENPERFPVVFD